MSSLERDEHKLCSQVNREFLFVFADEYNGTYPFIHGKENEPFEYFT